MEALAIVACTLVVVFGYRLLKILSKIEEIESEVKELDYENGRLRYNLGTAEILLRSCNEKLEIYESKRI